VPSDSPYLDERDTSSEMLAMQAKEEAGIAELAFDKEGRLTIRIKRFLNQLSLINQP